MISWRPCLIARCDTQAPVVSFERRRTGDSLSHRTLSEDGGLCISVRSTPVRPFDSLQPVVDRGPCSSRLQLDIASGARMRRPSPSRGRWTLGRGLSWLSVNRKRAIRRGRQTAHA
jgi:hypothetical protein